MPGESRGGADRTSHLVVSFPEGTDPAAAVAAVLEYSRVYDGATEAIRLEHPEIANLLDAAAMTLIEGRQLAEERDRIWTKHT